MTYRSGGAVWLNVLGRLWPGVSRGHAAQDLDTLMHNIVVAYPRRNIWVRNGSRWIPCMSPAIRRERDTWRRRCPFCWPSLLWFCCRTCANVATLTLVRFVSRRRELAIRQSLGANRMQLVRQMVLEGVVLSLVAGAVALVLTTWTSKTFAWFFPANSNPLIVNGSMDLKVVIGIAVSSLLAGILWRRAARLAFVARTCHRDSQGRVCEHLRRLTQPEVAQRAGGGADRAFPSAADVLRAVSANAAEPRRRESRI